MSATEPTQQRRRFTERIRRFSKSRRGLNNAAMLYRQAFWALSTLSLLLLLTLPSSLLNEPLADAFVLIIALLATAGLAVYCLLRWSRLKDDMSEAFHMEALAGNLNSRVISALDFLDRHMHTRLTDAVIERAAGDLERVPFETLLDRTVRNRSRLRFAVILAVTLALGFSPWFGFSKLGERGLLGWAALREWLVPTEWELLPGPGRHIVLLGDEVTTGVQFTRNPFDRISMVTTDGGDGEEQRTTLSTDASGVAAIAIKADRERVSRIFFEFGQRPTQTEMVELVFTDRPMIERMQFELIPPRYTREAPRDLDGTHISQIAGLPGTRVALGLTFSKPLNSATIRFEERDIDIPFDVSGRFASLNFVISERLRARITVEDIHGFGMLNPQILDIDLLADERPRLVWPGFLKQNMPFRINEVHTFGFGVTANDDYGVSSVSLAWRQCTVDDQRVIIAQDTVERIIDPPQTTVIAEFMNVFQSLNLSPGSLVSFHIEATDNREPTPQTISSPLFSLFIYQDELAAGRGDYADGFGMFGELWRLAEGERGRLGRARRISDVPAPQPVRAVGGWVSEWENPGVQTGTRAPVVHHDLGLQTEMYFGILSQAAHDQEKERTPPQAATPPQAQNEERAE